MNRIPVVLLALSLIAAACGGESSEDAEPPTSTTPPSNLPPVDAVSVSLDLPRSTANVSDGALAAIRLADSQFGLDLFDAVASDENLMFSPYSIAAAISMLYAGADGETAAEMADIMHIPDDVDLHAVRNHIDQLLATQPESDPEDEADPFIIRPANSIWGQAGFPFSDDYLTVLAENYGAGLETVNFASDPDGSRQLINGWVEDATEDRIKELLPKDSVDPSVALVLVNAIWFKASWAEPFLPENTNDGEFTLLDGSTVTVPLMHGGASQYAETDDYQALRLPYAGDASMVILLPKNDLTPSQLASQMTANDMAIDWGFYGVRTTLPSFTFDSEVKLAAALKALGISEAFKPSIANFDPITGSPNDLYLGGAFHKTFIALDEEGTEAAAATALVMRATSAPPPAEFTADRPFLFWIEHDQAGTLFMGQVTDPS